MAAYWEELDWPYLHRLETSEPDPRYSRVAHDAQALADRLRRSADDPRT
ncbi:hypothetical protein [Geochorda subterranea]|uniref:Uncharacterized protein n=1 Tax=Geochorda subterranea TaxID=3109564 RepID=A0ABZ1BPK9_9FIRM|nr:hypothetical protein [Limnochorda sp. LNt]WRP14481.1 hypothetical protein VLY81_13850 [Limnochorda sp. LNt]